jgi:hypothetical protein
MMLGFTSINAQLNMPNHDGKPMFFGVTFATNRSDFKIIHHQSFINSDSILKIESQRGPGFNLGIVCNFKIINHLDFRVLPSLSFVERNLIYTQIDKSIVKKTIESINLEFPFDLKLKSDRYGNFRVYALCGTKVAYDLNSNAKNRKLREQIKVNALDVAVTYGGGISFYFPMFMLSPEFKIYQGTFNTFARDPNLIYSRSIEGLRMRTFILSLHIEG